MGKYFRAIYIERFQLPEVRNELLDSEFKGALLSSEEHLAYLNAQVSPHKFYHKAEEIVFVFNLCLYLHRQSCLTEEINQNIIKFQSNGLMEAWSKEFVDRSFLKERIFTQPKILKIEQLYGAYELLAFGLLLSVVAFLIELLSRHVPVMHKFMMNL